MSDWRHQAICVDEDSELFFPLPQNMSGTAKAKRVCRRCPVADECLTWALDTGQAFGVWGGTSENERRSIRRRRKTAGALR